MKTKHIVFAALIISGFLIFSSFSQQEQSNKYLLVKSVEFWNLNDSYIITVDENGTTEKIELGRYKPSKIIDNAIKLNEVLNKVAIKGYKLESTIGTGDASFIIKDYYFIKK